MNRISLLLVGLSVSLLSYEAQARVGRDAHAMYLEGAKAAGGCKDKEFLAKLEKQYTACQAPEDQFKELYKAYDSAKADACNRRAMGLVQQSWDMDATFGKEMKLGGGDPSGCN